MPPATAAPKPSPRDRRDFYRITVDLPVGIQPESDTTDPTLVKQAVNISGGGIGLVVNVPYTPKEVLSVTLLLPDQAVFKSSMEVLRIEPLPARQGSYRLHARFIRLTSQNREVLIRYILHFQREHLKDHYLA